MNKTSNLLQLGKITQPGALDGQGNNTAIALYKGELVSEQQFLTDIYTLAPLLEKQDKLRWALFMEESYPFAVALFALFLAGKDVIIPGNNTPATEQSLNDYCDAFLGEFSQTEFEPTFLNQPVKDINYKPVDTANCKLTVFTSGSTGHPKAIDKSLEQFEHEIHALESTFGNMINDATIIATVSHQHIYGLIFRVLWPLAARRTFYSERALDPWLALKEITESDNGAIWIASPAHLKRLHENLPWKEAIEKLRIIFSSGGPLPNLAAQQIKSWMLKAPTEIYGSSETGGIAWREQFSGHSHWQPLPGVEITVSDDSRLLIRSQHLNPGNWFETDDAITLYSDGSFKLEGRLDRIVKLEEKRLSLDELEKYCLETAWVKEAYCHLIRPKNINHRQTLVSVIVLNGEGQALLENLGKPGLVKQFRETLANSLERSLIPRKWRFVEQIPCNEQSKPDKLAIEELFARDNE